MYFKSWIAAALVMTLGLVANAAPTAKMAPAVAAPMTEANPAAQDGDINAAGFIDSILWPEAFSRHCNDLLGISANLDQQIVRARMKTGGSCTAEQTTAIAVPPSCPTADYLIGILWPIAFDKQDVLSRRITAQVECLATLNGRIY
ncbi:hypothetical protein BGZ81_001311 [Podila clonocystis]|nr:hypothetical protein BGZ81_001311 [Podila clonocystis]